MQNHPLNDTPNTEHILLRMTTEAKSLEAVTGGPLTDPLAGWLAGEYAALTHGDLAAAEAPRRRAILREFVLDWTRLRRGDQTTARLQLARETLELHRENSYAQKEKQFAARLEEEKKKASQEFGCLTPEVLEKIEKELNLL